METLTLSSPDESAVVERYHLVDLALAPTTAAVPGNPFVVEFGATFYGPAGQALTVPGFYDGDNGYLVRFSPTVEGTWHYQSHSDIPALDGAKGVVHAVPNENPNIHGPLHVDPHHPHHFLYEDDTRCFLMGYEVNWLPLIDQVPSDLTRIDAFLDSIAGAGFNMVTINTYAHAFRSAVPEGLESDPRYATPRLAPWVGGNDSPDYDRFNVAFFRHYDRVTVDLLERGLLAHTMIQVYNKSVNWPEFGSDADDLYWRYFIARYQAFCNVIWDPAKESYRQPAAYVWDRLGLIRQLDGYRRLVTVHDANTPSRPKAGWIRRFHDPRKDLSDALADFKSDQVHQDWYADALRNYGASQRPYVNIEYGYERGVEALPSCNPDGWWDWREVLRRTWLVTMGGAYPNYYYCNTAWSLFLPFPEPPGYAAHRRHRDFWLGTHYWLLTPDNTPLGSSIREGVYCRANQGREYVVWDESGEGFELTVARTDVELNATWFDPITGERVDAGVVSNGTHHFVPPWGSGNWAVLHVRP